MFSVKPDVVISSLGQVAQPLPIAWSLCVWSKCFIYPSILHSDSNCMLLKTWGPDRCALNRVEQIYEISLILKTSIDMLYHLELEFWYSN